VLWTILRHRANTRLRSCNRSPTTLADGTAVDVSRAWRPGLLLLLVGIAVLFAIRHFSLEKRGLPAGQRP